MIRWRYHGLEGSFDPRLHMDSCPQSMYLHVYHGRVHGAKLGQEGKKGKGNSY